MAKSEGFSCLLWPVMAIWRLSHTCLGVAVRAIIVMIGFLLIVAGVLVSFTIIGLIIGIPMILLGFLLMVKGVF